MSVRRIRKSLDCFDGVHGGCPGFGCQCDCHDVPVPPPEDFRDRVQATQHDEEGDVE